MARAAIWRPQQRSKAASRSAIRSSGPPARCARVSSGRRDSRSSRCGSLGIGDLDQALEAAPARTDAEEPRACPRRLWWLLAHGVQHEGEKAAPSKSRFQIGWPGSFSSAGCMTRFTSERLSSQRATLSAAICCRCARLSCGSRAARGSNRRDLRRSRVGDTVLDLRPAALVGDVPPSSRRNGPRCISCPRVWNVDAALERPEIVRRPPGVVRENGDAASVRDRAIAGMSCISKVSEPGASQNTPSCWAG